MVSDDIKTKLPPLTVEMRNAVNLGVVQDASTARTLGHDGVVALLAQTGTPVDNRGDRFPADHVTDRPTGSATTPVTSKKAAAQTVKT
jgi:hypothetical protein